MTDRTVNERQRRQALRDRRDGIVRVTVKVPVEAADQVRTLADILRVQRQILILSRQMEDAP
jgi:hypothetical protein